MKYPVFIFNGITLVAWVLVLFSIIPFSLALILSLLQLMWLSLYLKKINVYYGKLGEFVNIMVNYFYLIKQIRETDFTSQRMKELKSSLFNQELDSLVAFGKLRKLLSGFDQRNNFLVGFFRNALYMSDFHFLMDLDKWKTAYGEYVKKWMETVHETDVLSSMATYHFNHPDFIFPTLKQDIWMEAEGLGHPLLTADICVCNDMEIRKEHNFYIITGANMAGKSTFLRAGGVNLVLALSGNVVFSNRFTFGLMNLFTSMRTTDNLAKGISYFHAELLRLKKLTEVAEKSERLFIILDEMLKGTNSKDKLNGSLKFLERLLLYPVSGLIATHDLALGKLAEQYPGNFFNSCFEIAHSGDEIKYDYKLKEGISQNMNASLLMEQMGLIDKQEKK
ncbi:MAG: hypothetical protein LIO65_01540 [Odoribacter sp.]|nr:hypothetical protein [Odoribacter sp.]